MKLRFWKKPHPHAKAEGGREARERSEMALIQAKAQRMRAEEVTSKVIDLATENHFSGKIAYMIRTGRTD